MAKYICDLCKKESDFSYTVIVPMDSSNQKIMKRYSVCLLCYSTINAAILSVTKEIVPPIESTADISEITQDEPEDISAEDETNTDNQESGDETEASDPKDANTDGEIAQDSTPATPDSPEEQRFRMEIRKAYCEAAITLYQEGLALITPLDLEHIRYIATNPDKDVQARIIRDYFDLLVGTEQNERMMEILEPLSNLWLTAPEINEKKLKSALATLYKVKNEETKLLPEILKKKEEQKKLEENQNPEFLNISDED